MLGIFDGTFIGVGKAAAAPQPVVVGAAAPWGIRRRPVPVPVIPVIVIVPPVSGTAAGAVAFVGHAVGTVIPERSVKAAVPVALVMKAFAAQDTSALELDEEEVLLVC